MSKLNILCCNPNGGAFLYITRGWENAFKTLGHNFERWDGSDQQLKKFKPNIYLGCSGWPQKFPKWARDTFKTKIGIHVNPWGSVVLKALPGEPDINEKPNTINWVREQKPDFLYCYGLKDDIQKMWNKWEANVAPVVPMPCAGDAVAHYRIAKDPNYYCEIGFVGGYWPYKALNINKYLMPVLNQKNAKIYGWGGWKHPKYKGTINDQNVNKLFATATICPSIVEPHTTRYGIDIPERMFKIPLAGGFTVCDPCAGLERYVSPKIFPIAKNPKDYADLIDYYLKNDDMRIRLKVEQTKAILKDHTYFTRIQGFLKFSGYDGEAKESQKHVEKMLISI